MKLGHTELTSFSINYRSGITTVKVGLDNEKPSTGRLPKELEPVLMVVEEVYNENMSEHRLALKISSELVITSGIGGIHSGIDVIGRMVKVDENLEETPLSSFLISDVFRAVDPRRQPFRNDVRILSTPDARVKELFDEVIQTDKNGRLSDGNKLSVRLYRGKSLDYIANG